MLPGFDSAEEDRKLRLFAVDSYVSLLQQEPDKLPQRFLQVISWVSLLFALWLSDGKEKKVFHLSGQAPVLGVCIGLRYLSLISVSAPSQNLRKLLQGSKQETQEVPAGVVQAASSCSFS